MLKIGVFLGGSKKGSFWTPFGGGGPPPPRLAPRGGGTPEVTN